VSQLILFFQILLASFVGFSAFASSSVECSELFEDKPVKPATYGIDLKKLFAIAKSSSEPAVEDSVPVERVHLLKPQLNDWEKYDGKEVDVFYDPDLLSFNEGSAVEMAFGEEAYGMVRLKVENTNSFAEAFGLEGRGKIFRLASLGKLAAQNMSEVGMFAIQANGRWYFSDLIKGDKKFSLSDAEFQRQLFPFLRNHPEIVTETSTIYFLHTHPRGSPFSISDVKAMPSIIKFIEFAEVKGVAIDVSGANVTEMAFTYSVPAEIVKAAKNK